MFSSLISDFRQLFFPHYCLGCGSDLVGPCDPLCLQCTSSLPHTGFANLEMNPVEQAFEGRVPFRFAFSEFYFSKGQIIQTLIHQLKYNGNKALGQYLGALMGASLLLSPRISPPDILIPLPMFAEKEFKRGYNQATLLCMGISGKTGIPVNNISITRNRATETQTKKHRTERWVNVEGSFSVQANSLIEGKHILLVDDVITTGATLEACAQTLLQIPGTSISFAAIAFASR
ncbi:MAG: ComF family protein [Chitinophagaceae bacterium]|nr:ComF family protein [Bacteroidota bacterium]MCC6257711.1 ComF family protein [Chitinophagaceae bacterium]MCW5916749.1 ComF family protein [Ferruginibacter sp.]